MNDNQAIRARARLALRAERALGVTTLPIPPDSFASGATPAQLPAAKPVAMEAALPTKNAELFGSPAAAPTVSNTATTPTILPLMQPFDAPVLSREQKAARLTAMDNNEIRNCPKCRLCESRTHTVFGEGDPDAKIFFIGEGPGENEDLQGRPFVGRAGELLNKWIAAMGLKREQVFIANIVKCRPPGNREPAPDEVATCTPYLERQLEIIRPRVIITLGRPSSQYMLRTKNSMGKMRGQWHQWRAIKLMPTYHPAYVLRNYTYETRAAVWSDLQQVMKELDLPIPRRSGAQQS